MGQGLSREGKDGKEKVEEEELCEKRHRTEMNQAYLRDSKELSSSQPRVRSTGRI